MKKEIKLGIFVLLAVLIGGYFIIKTESFYEFFTKRNQYPIIGRFASVAGMYPSAAVRLAGVKIGNVESIELDGQRARVRLMISNRVTVTSDARALIATIGFVGEKYVEIVYKDEFKTAQPRVIRAGEEIQTQEPFSLDEVKAKVDVIYQKLVAITDEVHSIISDKYSRDSLRGTLGNLKTISDELKTFLAENGKVSHALDTLDGIAGQLHRTAQSVDKLVASVSDTLTRADKGILPDIQRISERIDKITEGLKGITDDLRQGKGTAGKLLSDDTLYRKVDDSVQSLNSLLKDLESKKNKLEKIQMRYDVRWDYFGQMKKARTSLGLALEAPSFLLRSGVSENPENGNPVFSLLAGKRFKMFTLSAGLVESYLGANLNIRLWRERLSLDLFASRFYEMDNFTFRTVLSFSLTKNIGIQAGYYNVLNRNKNEFFLGIGFRN